MKNMKIDFLRVCLPKNLLWCWQRGPGVRIKVICSHNLSPWASSPYQDTPLAHSPALAALSCRVPPSGAGCRPKELSRWPQDTASHVPRTSPCRMGTGGSEQPRAPGAELEVRRSSLCCWEHFIQPGLEWSLGKQQLGGCSAARAVPSAAANSCLLPWAAPASCSRDSPTHTCRLQNHQALAASWKHWGVKGFIFFP